LKNKSNNINVKHINNGRIVKEEEKNNHDRDIKEDSNFYNIVIYIK